MDICIIYVLYGGLTMGTGACQSQMFYNDGLITPHEVVYTSHVPECWEGYVYHVPRMRVNFHGPNIRVKRYHDVRRRYNHRVRYHKHRSHRRHHYRRHKRRHHHKARNVRIYNRRIIHRHYY